MFFARKLLTSNSKCILPLKVFLEIDSKLIKYINKMMYDCYGFEDIVKNDIGAIMARIQFFESNEKRRYYL